MRSLHRTILIATISIMVPTISLAAKSTPTPTPTPIYTPQVTQISKTDAERFARLKEKGTKEISRRTEILTKQHERIEKMVFLRENDRKALDEQIKAEHKSLADILVLMQDQGATLAQMRGYIVAINAQYRTFSVVAPKVSIMIGLDHLGAALEDYDTISKELKERSEALKASGKLTTTTQTQLAAMQQKLDDTHTRYKTIHDSVLPVRATDFAAIKGTLQTQRDALRASYEAMKKILEEARTVRQALDKA